MTRDYPTSRDTAGHRSASGREARTTRGVTTNMLTCLCGHLEAAHQHYRPGSDCGPCGRGTCPTYRPAHPSGWDEGQIAVKNQRAAIARMVDRARHPGRALAVLAACLPYAVRHRAARVDIPAQRSHEHRPVPPNAGGRP